MDSKLPKPSGLKRPMPIPKNILPTDRIKPSGSNNNSNLTNKCAAATHSSWINDLTNFPDNLMQKKGRAASPEPNRCNPKEFTVRAKLRRSRSACDMRALNTIRKRAEPTLPTIPSKTMRIASGLSVSSTTSHVTTASTRFVRNNITQPIVAKPKPLPVPPRVARTATNKAIANKEETKGTAAAPTKKRIAPYDFKARFNDLLEKHKALKTKYEKQCDDMVDMESARMKFEDTQSKLKQATYELEKVKSENECLQRQVKSQATKIDTITCSLGSTKAELTQLKTDYNKIKIENTELTREVYDLRERTQNLTKSNNDLLEEITQCKEQLFQSNMERKELHNTVMDLRGNIRVFCRVRPPLESETSRLLCGWNYIDEATVEIQNLDSQTKHKIGTLTFSFDQVFHPHSDQLEIFEMVSPLIQSALDGYNICIFAYGQTGSGKTYTMDGIPDNVGVIPRTVDLLFDAIENYKNLGWIYQIKVTFLEIYNEVLYDLLSNEQKDMEIRMSKHNKNDIYVSNITEETVTTANRLRQLMNIAKMNRATAATVGNERSSRSHAVTKLELIGTHAEKHESSVGTINLVDLAGSESPKTSIRMMETKNINRSLSELTNVILALLQKQDHIPYRNSKLTHLLMPSLGGNSKTLMFINVSPFQDCFQESVKSLRFASSVNSCKMSKVKRNRILNTSTVNSSSSEK